MVKQCGTGFNLVHAVLFTFGKWGLIGFPHIKPQINKPLFEGQSLFFFLPSRISN